VGPSIPGALILAIMGAVAPRTACDISRRLVKIVSQNNRDSVDVRFAHLQEPNLDSNYRGKEFYVPFRSEIRNPAKRKFLFRSSILLPNYAVFHQFRPAPRVTRVSTS